MITIQKGSEYSNSRSAQKKEIDFEFRSHVSQIIERVRKKRDHALIEFTQKFNQIKLDSLRVPEYEIEKAGKKLHSDIRNILKHAIRNIREFHQYKIEKSWINTNEDGTRLGQIVSPIDRVGVYIPGGKAVYPSTLLMNVIPAQLANVPEIVLVSPPVESGYPHELVLASCDLLGVKEIYAVGGAQSIAALAYGTESIRPVYKITGPGNTWVTEAKRQVFGQVGIDSVAGPSEILLLHDDPSIPVEYLVRDMLSQAEHGTDSVCILITTEMDVAKNVLKRLEDLVPSLPRKDIMIPALKNHGRIFVVDCIEDGIALVNQIAPEHLELLIQDETKISLIRNAGAIFIGKLSSEPVGDYFAGPNHTIPTSGAAKYASPLGVQDFQKQTSLIAYSKKRLQAHGPSIVKFAALEKLFAHGAAIQVRLDNLK